MTTQQIVDLLNEVNARDGVGLGALLSRTVDGQALADHPTIPVGPPWCTKGPAIVFSVMGLLNGIAAIDGQVIEAEASYAFEEEGDTQCRFIYSKFQARPLESILPPAIATDGAHAPR